MRILCAFRLHATVAHLHDQTNKDLCYCAVKADSALSANNAQQMRFGHSDAPYQP